LAVLAIVVVMVEIAVLAVLAGLGVAVLSVQNFAKVGFFWISGSPYITLTPALKKSDTTPLSIAFQMTTSGRIS
jgi:hypothetical protein